MNSQEVSSGLALAASAFEHACWDPKDGELCLGTMKPGETLVEVGNGVDVQIARQIWV